MIYKMTCIEYSMTVSKAYFNIHGIYLAARLSRDDNARSDTFSVSHPQRK